MLRKGLNAARGLARGLLKAGRAEWRRWLKPRGPQKPWTVNFLVNDICNSKCEMCLIWERKRDHEVSPDELRHILADPLYADLRYVGVSGGEPTLRADLPDLFRAVCETVPSLNGIGIITNAIRTEQVIARVTEAAGIARAHGKRFNLMVSLDGVGEVHDRVRGYPGNFESAMAVIRHFRDITDIPLAIGCTLTRTNVWDAENVLDLCRREGVHGRFRVAEFIDRLYNAGRGDVIRSFTDVERYQLALFFKKLEVDYETDPAIRETYRNIRRMVFDGAKRESGCPYQDRAVLLNSRGELAYCAPKSPTLGSCLTDSALRLYKDNLPVRQRIIAEDCPNCIHDYHAPPTDAARHRMAAERDARKALSVARALERADGVPAAEPGSAGRLASALVIGWYGTETAGDKAILWDVVRRLREGNPDARIAVASLHPFVTRWTLRELGLTDVEIVETYSADFLTRCRESDAVVMGGGPLMGMEPLGLVLAAFAEARKAGRHTVVDGCGIGPLAQDDHIRTVARILRLANEIRVRDEASLAWVKERTGRTDAACSGDPAAAFVTHWRQAHPDPQGPGGPGYAACFLRELTTEYAGGRDADAFTAFREAFERELIDLVASVAAQTGLTPLLMPMHTFAVGRDDREFARRVARALADTVVCEVADRVYAPADILAAMVRSPFNVCMRFHSVLFAETLGVPFVAIDYTGGGKIRAFLEDRGRDAARIDREDLARGDWRERLSLNLPAAPGHRR